MYVFILNVQCLSVRMIGQTAACACQSTAGCDLSTRTNVIQRPLPFRIYKHHAYSFWLFVDWFHAVQAMLSIGLIMLLISLLLIAIYMCIHTVSKNSTIIALVCFCFLSGKYFTLSGCHANLIYNFAQRLFVCINPTQRQTALLRPIYPMSAVVGS